MRKKCVIFMSVFFFAALCLPAQAVRTHLWSFDESASPWADSDGGPNVTSTTATVTDGILGSALRFDNLGLASASITGQTGFGPWQLTDSFSFSYWVRTTVSNTERNMPFSQTVKGTAGTYYAATKNGMAQFMLRGSDDSGYNTIDSGVSIADGEWHHVVFVRDGTDGSHEIYVDGVSAKKMTAAEMLPYNAGAIFCGGPTLYLGSWGTSLGTTKPDLKYEGDLDELAIFNHALTAADVSGLFGGGGGGAAINPVPLTKSDPNYVDVVHTAVTQLEWDPSDDPNIVSVTGYTVYFGIDPNVIANPSTYVTTDSLPVTLSDNTNYFWRVDSDVVWDSNSFTETASTSQTVEGGLWSFTTFPIDLFPVITDADDILTSITFDPMAILSATVSDPGGTPVSTVTWEPITDPNNVVVEDLVNDPSAGTQSAKVTVPSAGVYEVKLTVADSTTPVEHIFTVQVGANPCLAAQAGSTWAGFNASDTDEDCDVDLADLAAFAEQWLDNRNLLGQKTL